MNSYFLITNDGKPIIKLWPSPAKGNGGEGSTRNGTTASNDLIMPQHQLQPTREVPCSSSRALPSSFLLPPVAQTQSCLSVFLRVPLCKTKTKQI